MRNATVLCLVLACFGLAACGGNSATQKGYLRVGQPPFTAIDNPNPFVATIVTPWQFVYPELVQYDDHQQIQPDFAKSWTTSKDGLTWTFKTVANAKWSDGKPLTARDVAWTVNTLVRYRNGGAAQPAAVAVPNVAGAKALDDTTVQIRYVRPTALALSGLTALYILPQHKWEQYATGTDGKALTTFANNPPFVSGGPFIWKSWKKGSFASFVANPHWWGPKSKLKGFGIRLYSNEDAMISALKSNEIDAVDYISPANADAVAKAGIKVVSAPGMSVDTFQINSNVKRRVHPELLDPQVREALDMAIDRKQIVDVVFGGKAQPGSSIIPAADGDWHDSSIAIPFDTAKGNAILDRLGYKRGAGGIRVANGHPMSYRVVFPSYLEGPGTRELAIIKQGFAKIGVKIEALNVDGAAAHEAQSGPNDTYLNMDMAMGNWIPYVDPDFLFSTFTCSTWGSWNNSGYCNADYDKAYVAQGRILDVGKRRQAVYDLQRRTTDLHTQIALVYPDWTSAYRPGWSGFGTGGFGWFGTSTNAILAIGKD